MVYSPNLGTDTHTHTLAKMPQKERLGKKLSGFRGWGRGMGGLRGS